MDTLTLDIYPAGKTNYQLYEDDGLTRAYKQNKFATTNISCDNSSASTIINIDAIKGSYENMLPQRNYVLQIHTTKKPSAIIINNKKLSASQYHFSNNKAGLLVINCGKFDANKNVEVRIQ